MKKVLLYPGAFNPPHYGHVSAVELALKNKSFDEVWIMPSGKRDDKTISTSYEDRRNLGNLFVEYLQSNLSVPVKLLTDELDDTTSRYTQDILREVKSTPDVEIIQLIGTDGIIHLKNKLSPEDFIKEKYIVIQRVGYELPDDFSHAENLLITEDTSENISSTQIRDMLKTNIGKIEDLVPEKIASYIKKHNLYQ
jgi:nicotinate-nucleotide adenylyltransferase